MAFTPRQSKIQHIVETKAKIKEPKEESVNQSGKNGGVLLNKYKSNSAGLKAKPINKNTRNITKWLNSTREKTVLSSVATA